MDWAGRVAYELRRTLRLGVPLDVDELCRRLGIEVLHIPTRLNALYYSDNCAVYIVVARRYRPKSARWRVLLGHEIGHHCTIPEGANQVHLYQERNVLADRLERWAEHFAFELLMPTTYLQGLLCAGARADEVADACGVTVTFAERRLHYWCAERARMT